MTSYSSYHRILSLIVIGVLCWNFAGTLISGLIVNHLHTQGEGSFCEVTFCTCNVEDGHKICTCHHPELQRTDYDHDENLADHQRHSSDHKKAGFCYFSGNHNQAESIPSVLVEFNKYNAIYVSDGISVFPHRIIPFSIQPHPPILSGVVDDLLKPPRLS